MEHMVPDWSNWTRKLRDAPDGRLAQRVSSLAQWRALARLHLGPLQIVSAWAAEDGIALGQVATEQKSNESTTIPEILESRNQ